ncbi:lysophospholipid acyltransferase family protein [Amycolatopsis rhizosphaerae]|nr:lysophospholipid acyltransferase family protein [Amycolatopsis rhizosphaerae]
METARRWTAAAGILAGALPAAAHGELGPSARRLLSGLGVEVAANTERLSVPDEARGTLIVANHLSWLDIIAALAVEPTGFLAKAELRRWPVVGRVAARAGTRFVDRGTLRGLPAVVAGLSATLAAGRSVLVFPEGTTWCGRCGSGGPFRRAAFQAAIDAGAPIRPVTFAYHQAGRPSTVASFVGDDTLFDSLRRITRARDLRIDLTAHPPFAPDGDRRELAARAQAVITGEPVHV